jgi:hypothetical protein
MALLLCSLVFAGQFFAVLLPNEAAAVGTWTWIMSQPQCHSVFNLMVCVDFVFVQLLGDCFPRFRHYFVALWFLQQISLRTGYFYT